MRHSPRNLRLAWDHKGLTHFGGIYFFREFLRVRPFRNFLAQHLTYPRRQHHSSLSQMIRALVSPIVLGLDRMETASFLRSHNPFPYLTGLPRFPAPQTLRRCLLQAPPRFWEQLPRVNDRLLPNFLHFDLDSTGVTGLGRQEQAAVGSHPRYRGQRSYNPLRGLESNSSFLGETERRPGHAGTGDGSGELWDPCFANVPPDIREWRVRADAGCGGHPVFEALEARPAP